MNQQKHKILHFFGTRPEAIKFAPLIKEMNQHPEQIEQVVCVSGQHRQMLDSVLEIFQIKPDFDLDVMKPGQDLYDITTNTLLSVKDVLKSEKPDMVVVQGDTTTTFIGALAAYYEGIHISHLEAGLRTGNKYSPFPEEGNRKLISTIADLSFPPTTWSEKNLLDENTNPKNVHVVGNTVIDALYHISEQLDDEEYRQKILKEHNFDVTQRKFILVTGHRRENFGGGMERVCEALHEIALKYSNQIDIIYAVHLNPNVQKPVNDILKDCPNIHLWPPLDYKTFIYMMKQCYLILTDSGGVQEEAPSLGKPVLVTRECTERPEGIEAGVVKLVGTSTNKIVEAASQFIEDSALYKTVAQTANPYGDGHASERIVKHIVDYLNHAKSTS